VTKKEEPEPLRRENPPEREGENKSRNTDGKRTSLFVLGKKEFVTAMRQGKKKKVGTELSREAPFKRGIVPKRGHLQPGQGGRITLGVWRETPSLNAKKGSLKEGKGMKKKQ